VDWHKKYDVFSVYVATINNAPYNIISAPYLAS